MTKFEIGDVVVFIDCVGEYPIQSVLWGETGTVMGWVNDGENDLMRVRMDLPHIDLQDWDNEIHVHELDLKCIRNWGDIPFDYLVKTGAVESFCEMLGHWAAVESFRVVDAMSEDSMLDHICGTIQSVLGQTDGGLAAIIFSGPHECYAAVVDDRFAMRARAWSEYVFSEFNLLLEEQVANQVNAG